MEGDGDRIRIVVMGDNQVKVWDGLKYEIVLDFDYLVRFQNFSVG